jgi:hypothetical protein
MVEVIPVSDPNNSTMAQRIMQYQAVMQMAATAPQIYDMPYLHRQMIEVLGIKNAEKLVPLEDDLKPKDPISENMGFLTSKPTKAFIYQDHDAHLIAHQSFMQDPMIAATIGQTPMAQKIQAEIMAHIAEHLGFKYRRQMEEQIGAQLFPPNEELPEDVEVELSRLIAEGAKQVLQSNQSQAQQQQAQQAAQDPLVQLQQAELQIKQAEVQSKTQKAQSEIAMNQAKLQIEADKLKLEMMRMQNQKEIELARIQEQTRSNNQKVQVDLFKRGTK